MPVYHRIYSPGELQFITSSTCRRAQVFRSPRFCQCFVQRLDEVRQKMHCLLIGWVLMPEHFHLLLQPQPAESTPVVIKKLKEEPARRILKTLRENQQHPWCQKLQARLRSPPSVHDESHFRPWTVIPSAARNLARSIFSALRDSSSPVAPRNDSNNEFSRRLSHPFDVYAEAKRREKLNDMHNNPVKRGLMRSPGDWPWSSWRFYFLQGASVLRMDRLE